MRTASSMAGVGGGNATLTGFINSSEQKRGCSEYSTRSDASWANHPGSDSTLQAPSSLLWSSALLTSAAVRRG